MKKYLRPASICCLFVFLMVQLYPIKSKAQVNVDFEQGNFNNWTGTWGPGTFCITAPVPAPTANAGFNQGPNNSTPGSMPKYYQFITTGGLDSQLLAYGYSCPVVWPGSGSYSARIGTTHAYGEGESISYQFVVTAANCNFTYHYAVSLGQGTGLSHLTEATQPYFDINMTNVTTNTVIACAEYKVDGLSAASIPGFISIPGTVTNNDAVYYKPWSSVFVPLNAYIGQTVKITFTAASCSPFCGGSHWAYAYIDADCSPLTLVASSPAICGSHTVTLTAPVGAASYAWTGPGVIPPANTQTVSVNQAGVYSVTMTTFGTNPCTFTIDTTITASPANPAANFSAPTACLGSPTVFTDLSTPAGSITGWSWNYGDASALGNTQNPSHTYATAGTFPVKLSISWPPCVADTTINVNVVTPATSNFTATPSVCAGQVCSVNYTGNGSVVDSFAWNFNGATVISGTGMGPYQVNWSSAGVKNITLTVFAGSCASTVTTVPVTVTAFPGLTLSTDTAICPGGSAHLSVSGVTSYAWAPAGSLSSSTAANVVATPATTTTYTVTGNNASCTVTDVVTVRVRNKPTSTFTVASPAVCTGQNDVITFTGTASAAATYTWAFTGDTTVTGSGAGPLTLNVSTSGNESISLIVVDSSCTSTITTVPVTINPIPSSTFTATSPVCTGVNSIITYTGNAVGAPTYTWGFAGGTVASGTAGTAGPFQVNWPTAGTENITLSVTSNGCSSNSSASVTVNPFPASTFTATSPVCAFQNSTITFTGTASANANYQWSFSGANIISGSNAGPYVVNWATAGTPNVTLSVTDGGCTSTLTTVPVTVNPTPSAAFTTTTPICIGQTSNITYTGTGTGAGSYAWNWDGGIVVSGTNQGPYVITWATPGTKNITLAVTENACTSAVADSQVIVYAVPVAAFSVTSPVCVSQNSTITFTGSADNAAVYTWNFAGGTIASGTPGTAGPYQVNWATAGTQNVTLSITDHICVSNDTLVPVVVNAIPVSNAGADVAFCSGDSALIGAAAVNGYTYSWSPATGLSSPAVANPYADGTNNTSATLVTMYVVTTSAGGCFSTDTVIDSIYPLAVATFAPMPGQCLVPNNFNFQAGGSFLPSATFSWNFGTNGVPAASTNQNQAVSFSAPGLQTVSLTINQLGCASSTYTSTVNVFQMPFPAFIPDTTFGCQTLQVCFANNSLTNNPSNYTWFFGDGQTSTALSACNTYSAPGVYTVELKLVSADGCPGDTIMPNLITVSPNPKAAFIPVDATIQLPVNTISLSNQSTNAVSYLWDLGALGTSTVADPSLTFTLPGSYPIVLKALSTQGCVDSTSGKIIVLPPTNYFIPNVFTPNGDGHNDGFYIEAQEGINVYKFEIFDRWGEMVYSGLFPWDGTYKGKPCPEGVYIYVAQIGQAGQEQAIIRKGSVTLIR